MALDTAAKRYSAMNPLSPWRHLAVVPSGTIAVEDRAAVLFLFGIAADEPEPDPPVIVTTSFPAGFVGVPYSRALVTTGADPKTYAVIAGILPDGLSIHVNTGVVSGTPTTEEIQAGVEIEVTNADGSDSAIFTFTILAAQGGGPLLSGEGVSGAEVSDTLGVGNTGVGF